MRKTTYIYAVLCVITITLCTINCTDEDLTESNTHTEIKGFSLQEAKEYFLSQAEKNLILSRSLENKEIKTVSPGDFIPNWDIAIGASKNGLACYDIPITPTYRFKAIYVDERNGLPSAGKVNVYQKLVIVKDVKNKKMSQYILTLIPSKSYDNRNGIETCSKFINCADKGEFTGIAIYSCVYSQVTARISTFKNGIKRKGVFILNSSDKNELAKKCEQARMLVSPIAIHRKSALLTRGENDYNYDDDFDYDVTYDGGWIEGEVVITPEPDYNDIWEAEIEKWLEETRPNGTVDPEPSEPDQPVEEDDYVSNDNQGDQNPEEKSIPLSASEKKEVNKLLDQLEKLKNIDRSKYKIEKQTFCRSTARLSKDGTLLLCHLFFNSKNLQEIDKSATIWHEIYHIDHKHYGELKMQILEKPEILVPPPHIEKILNERLDIMYEGFTIDVKTRQADFNQELFIDRCAPIEYYKNELETHKAERENFPNVSHYYENERTWLEWTYEQLLIIATKEKSKK